MWQLSGRDCVVVIDLIRLKFPGTWGQGFLVSVQGLVAPKSLHATCRQRGNPTSVIELGVRGWLLWVVQFSSGANRLPGWCPHVGGIGNHIHLSSVTEASRAFPLLLMPSGVINMHVLIIDTKSCLLSLHILPIEIALKTYIVHVFSLSVNHCELSITSSGWCSRRPSNLVILKTPVGIRWVSWPCLFYRTPHPAGPLSPPHQDGSVSHSLDFGGTPQPPRPPRLNLKRGSLAHLWGRQPADSQP